MGPGANIQENNIEESRVDIIERNIQKVCFDNIGPTAYVQIKIARHYIWLERCLAVQISSKRGSFKLKISYDLCATSANAYSCLTHNNDIDEAEKA